ncbi:MAG TPA: hypothetical protein VGJ81_17510 [Thermoanaerobaculia bacterium]
MAESPEVVDWITPEELIDELRRLRARIPQFEPVTSDEHRRMVRVAHLDPEFVKVGMGAINANPDAAAVVIDDREHAAGIQNALLRWTLAQREFEAMTAGVAGANLRRRHRIGQLVLIAYAAFRTMIRQPEWNHLIPWVERMRETNGFGHRRG